MLTKRHPPNGCRFYLERFSALPGDCGTGAPRMDHITPYGHRTV